MKSPAELGHKLARQWQNADLRVQRLLQSDTWPLRLPIGKPTSSDLTQRLDRVRTHLEQWRQADVGQVEWQAQRFRSTGEAVDVPVYWVLRTPSEWVAAVSDRTIRQEYQMLNRLAAATDSRFHRLMIRRRTLVLTRPGAEVIRATELALALSPGCAHGKPLRSLALAGIDSKFFERNRALIIALLDVLHEGQATDLGLEAFLDAEDEGHHWLLLVDLDGGLLPFKQQRVRARELQHIQLPGDAILVVENEQCLHQLPATPGTLAILGAGLNLAWMQAEWLANKRLAYWGDIDTWGLSMLARAREYQPHLMPLLMSQAVFDEYRAGKAVAEHEPSETWPEVGLTEAEQQLYRYLLGLQQGRLEQEFLPVETVHRAVHRWRQCRRD
ncbi:MAG: Wadjet anti-phage system protein JetD domain-containing protein [Saccharospirillum sp.]